MKVKIGIIGLGLMGGALAKSLISSEKVSSIIAYDTNTTCLKNAYSEKKITKFTTSINEDFSYCDIIFICTPASYVYKYAKELEKVIKKDCIVTDVASTKKTILDKTAKLNITFIGGHPMAGSEKSGYNNSHKDIFKNAYYILTKTKNTDESKLEILKSIIKETNCIPIIIEAEKHDYAVAVISHTPQIIASTLVNMVKDLENDDKLMQTLACGGFKDTTRIASSDPIMWQSICKENKEEIIKVLKIFINKLEDFIANIDDQEKVYKFLCDAKIWRDNLIKNNEKNK